MIGWYEFPASQLPPDDGRPATLPTASCRPHDRLGDEI
jgi:hypothetical protein